MLQEVESVLSGFMTKLGSVSSEIKSLQTESQEMNAKLNNRRLFKARCCGGGSGSVDLIVIFCRSVLARSSSASHASTL